MKLCPTCPYPEKCKAVGKCLRGAMRKTKKKA